MRGVAITAVLGLDQAARSGWAVTSGRTVAAHGVVVNHAGGSSEAIWNEHRAVVARALSLAGDKARLLIVREKHDNFWRDYLTTHDHKTERKGRQGAPERSKSTGVGIGKPWGYWQAVLDSFGLPRRLRIDAEPCEWRRRIHGVVRGDVKRAARDWASIDLGMIIADDDEAEAICLSRWGAIDGVMKLEAKLRDERVKARGKRNERRQLELGNA